MLRKTWRVLAGVLAAATLAGCGFTPLSLGGGSSRFKALDDAPAGDYQLFIEPDEGQAPVLKAIQNAQHSVDVVVYILSSPDVLSALVGARQRGVQVRVLMEPKPFNPSNPNFPLPINRKSFDQLKAAGADVRWSSPRFAYTHQKTIVVDNQTAYIMTANLSKAAFANNREYGIVDRAASDVAEVENIFNADWNQQGFTPSDPDLVVSPDNSRDRLKALIASAKQSVVVQDEVLGDQDLSGALGERAKAGVDVRVQLARFKPGGLGDTNAQERKELNDAGVTQVRFLAKPVLHAKLIVIDGTAAYVGSVNLTTNSMANNRELGVIVHDPSIVSRLAKVADRDWRSNDDAPAATSSLAVAEQ